MRWLAITASISLLGCANQEPRETHSDLYRAMQTWGESGVTDYSYNIKYFQKGCQFADAKVYVSSGKATHRLRKTDETPCLEISDAQMTKTVSRTVANLFEELVFYHVGGTLGIPHPVAVEFDSELGYPRRSQLLISLDRKIFSITPGSDVPVEFEWTVSEFKVLANGR